MDTGHWSSRHIRDKYEASDMGQPHHLGLDPSVESGVERRDNFRGHLIRRCGKTGPLLSYICLPLFAVTHTASRKSGSSKMLSGKAFLITTFSHASATCDGATVPKCFEAAATPPRAAPARLPPSLPPTPSLLSAPSAACAAPQPPARAALSKPLWVCTAGCCAA